MLPEGLEPPTRTLKVSCAANCATEALQKELYHMILPCQPSITKDCVELSIHTNESCTLRKML